MKFPIDVESSIRNSGKATVAQKLGLLAFGVVFINIFIFSYLTLMLINTKPLFILGILAQVVITVSVCVALFRYKILREDDKVQEYENSKETSLSNYWYITDKDNMEEIEKVPIFEYSDSNYMIAMTFSYGTFTRETADETRELYQCLYRDALKEGFEIRTIEMPEKFEESAECRNFLGNLSRIKEDTLSNIMRDISDNLLHVCSEYNSLMSTTYFIRTVTPVSFQGYKIIIRRLMQEYSTRDHSLRSISFLDGKTIRPFMRDYYGLEALDLANLKTSKIDKDTLINYRDFVRVGELGLVSGEVNFVNDPYVGNKSKKIFNQ